MKKLIGLIAILALVAIASQAQADYVETIDIYEYSVGEPISWQHTYDFSVTEPVTALLSIVADDVDADEDDAVYLGGIFLGYLNQLPAYSNWGYEAGPGNSQQELTTTVFDITPYLADIMDLQVSIESSWGVEIETSTLTVCTTENVPIPGAVWLLGSGLVGLAGLRRKRAK